VCVCVCDRRAP